MLLQSGGIVFIGDQVILRKTSNNNIFIFPKGKVEPGESLEEAAEREVREETGIVSRAGLHICETKFRFEDKNYELHIYLMEFVKKSKDWSNHIGNDTFLHTPEKALQLLEYEIYKQCLRFVLKKEGKDN